MANDPNQGPRNEDNEVILESYEILELMEEAIPSETTELGSIEDETDNFTSCQTNDKYFITPLQEECYD